MADKDRQELHDRRLVPADDVQRYHIVRDDPRDKPTVGIFDPPIRCYPVNQEWAKHIMGAVSVLSLWTAWTGEEDDRNLAVQEIFDFMVGEVCGMFQLRQSTTEPCLLEQTIDGGDNWIPAFDFSLCAGGGSDAAIQIYIDIAITNIAILNQLYIDAGLDITIMFPNLEYDSGPEDADRDTAICYALEALTEGVFNAVEERILNLLDKQGLLSSIVKFMTGGWFASEGSLLAALSNSVVDAIFGSDALEAAADALSNTSARRNVVCCLYEQLEGATVTFAAWQLARSSCNYAPASDEELLLDILDPLFAGLDAYLSWVSLVSNGVDLAVDDIIGNDCLTCGQWIASIDFTSSDGGFVLDGLQLGDDFGEYLAGTGWHVTTLENPQNPVQDMTAVVITLAFTGGTYTLTQADLTFDYTLGTWTGSSQLAQRITRGTTTTSVNKASTSDGDDQVLSTPSTPVAGAAKFDLFLRTSLKLKTESPTGDALMTNIQIMGSGAIPPELLSYII